jgi:hypothetical protein
MSGREIRLVITGKSKHTAGELVSFEEISVIQGTVEQVQFWHVTVPIFIPIKIRHSAVECYLPRVAIRNSPMRSDFKNAARNLYCLSIEIIRIWDST